MSFRSRRLLLALLALPVLFLFYLASPAISDLFSGTSTQAPAKLPDEIYGLLHFVTSPDESGRLMSAQPELGDAAGNVTHALEHGAQLKGAVAPDKPVAMSWYALGSITKTGVLRGQHSARGGWEARLKTLRDEYPLVVFSKSYCPYSKRAKKLLETYDLVPAPKIIEVDGRADSAHIKTVLSRLTGRSTFPNIILHGRSLGGSDELIRLHEENRLRQEFDKVRLKVGWVGEGGKEIH